MYIYIHIYTEAAASTPYGTYAFGSSAYVSHTAHTLSDPLLFTPAKTDSSILSKHSVVEYSMHTSVLHSSSLPFSVILDERKRL